MYIYVHKVNVLLWKDKLFQNIFLLIFIIKKSFWNVNILRWTGIYIKYNLRNWYWKVIFCRLHFDNHLYDKGKQPVDLYSVLRPEKRFSLFKKMKIFFFKDLIWLACERHEKLAFLGEEHHTAKCYAFPTSHRSK